MILSLTHRLSSCKSAASMSSIIQWNIRVLHANRKEFNMFLSDVDPTVVCLQETFHKSDEPANFNNYSFYCISAKEVNSISHGGVGILVKNSVPHKRCQLNSSLQAIALRITCNKTITVCSIYLSPSLKFNSSDLDDLITQLSPPVLLLGDFNAHSTLWGSSKTGVLGKQIEDLLQKQNLCLLSDGSSTHIHSATASASAIDLSICSPAIFLDLQWNLYDDLCGSDHYPITISYDTADPSHATPSWNLRKANWDHSSEYASMQLRTGSSSFSAEDFSEKRIDITAYTIPKSKPSVRKNTIWFNDECKETRSNRKKALQKVKFCPTDDNIQRYKIIRAKTRRTIKTARCQSWQRFVSSINSAPLLKKYGTLLIKSLERDPQFKSCICRMVIKKLHPLLI